MCMKTVKVRSPLKIRHDVWLVFETRAKILSSDPETSLTTHSPLVFEANETIIWHQSSQSFRSFRNQFWNDWNDHMETRLKQVRVGGGTWFSLKFSDQLSLFFCVLLSSVLLSVLIPAVLYSFSGGCIKYRNKFSSKKFRIQGKLITVSWVLEGPFKRIQDHS